VTKEEIVAAVVRIAAFVTALQSLWLGFLGWSGEGAVYEFVGTLVFAGLYLVLALIIWRQALSIAQRLLKGIVRNSVQETWSTEKLQIAGITVVGVVFVATAAIDLLVWLFMWEGAKVEGIQGFTWKREYLAGVVGTFAQLGLGTVLIGAGPRIVARLNRF